MADVSPRLPVRRELRAKIRDLGGAQPDEDLQPEAAGRRKRLGARRRHADRWMGKLIRPRHNGRVLDPIELSLVAEGLAGPRAPDDLERLEEACLAFGVRDAKHVVGAHRAAAADPILEASFADLIDGRNLFGDAQRMIEREDLYRGSHAQAPRARGDRARYLQ